MNATVMKTNNGKRLIAAAAVLALALCVCVVAIPAEESDAITADEFLSGAQGNQIVLSGNTTVEGAVTLNDMNVNLAGYTLTVDSIDITNSTISNGTVIGTGSGVVMTLKTDANLNGVTITQNGSYASIIDVVAGSNVTINDCTFTDKNSATTSVYINGDEDTTVEITGCDLGIDTDARSINWIGAPGQLVIEDCTATHIQVCGDKDVASEYILGEDVIISNTKIDKLYVNIESGNTDGTSKFSVPAGQELTVDILDGNGTSAEVAGTLTVLETANKFTVNVATSGNYVVSTTVTDANQTTLDAAYENNESVYISEGEVTEVSIPEGKTLVIGSSVTFKENSIITTAPQSTVIIDSSNKTFTVKNAGTTDADSVKFTDFSGEVTITYGSVSINGTDYSGTLEVSGEVDLSGSIKGAVAGGTGLIVNAAPGSEITIDKNLIIGEGGLAINNTGADDADPVNVLILEGVNVNIDTKLSIDADVRVNNYGNVVGGTVDVAKDGTFYSATAVDTTFTGPGNIDLGDAMETLQISDKLASSAVLKPTQNVLINGNLTIKSGEYLVITGSMEVAEGVTVTINEGGLLMVYGPAASADIKGTIISKGAFNGTVPDVTVATGAAGFTYYDGKSIDVSGTINAKKATNEDVRTVWINGDSEISGTVTIDSKAKAEFGGETKIVAGGTLNINGTYSGTILNQGTVNLNGFVDAGAKVFMNSTDAVLNVTALKGTTNVLTVTDEKLYLKTEDNGTRTYVASADANVITLLNVKGVTVTEGYTYTTDDDGDRIVHNNLYIAGTLNAQDSKASNGKLTVENGTLTVSGELTVAKADVTVKDVAATATSSAGATLKVTGTVYVTDDESSFGITADGQTGTGILTVTGLVRSVYELDTNFATINAVKYEQTIENIPYYFYTNLAAAIESGEESLTVLGDLYILEDTTIPAGITVDASESNVYVGSTEDEITDITLTVANGGLLMADNIYVDATMMIENTDTGIDCNNIVSDVSTTTETTAKYTNIYTALSQAQSGETVTITKKADSTGKAVVSLVRDVEIKDGVTLMVPGINVLQIAEGVTLTNNGILDVRGAVEAIDSDKDNTARFGTATVDDYDREYAVIVNNGTIVSVSKMDFSKYQIAGAYYTINGKFYITPVEDAVAQIGNTETDSIVIYGKNTVGTVVFVGTVEEPVKVIIDATAEITADSMTVTNGTIVANGGASADGAVLNGTYGGSTGTVVLANMTVPADATFTIEDKAVTVSEQTSQVTYVSGFIENVADADNKLVNSIEFNGAVSANKKLAITIGTTDKKDFIAIGEGATFTVAGNGAEIEAAAITVNGTLVADNAGIIDVETVTVAGTMNVMSKTDKTDAGKIDISKLFIGGEPGFDFAATSAAAVNGDLTGVGTVYLFAQATLDEAATKTVSADGVKNTQFYIEDVLWMTIYDVYVNTPTKIQTIDGSKLVWYIAPDNLTNSIFDGWQVLENGKYVLVNDEEINVGSEDAVYAYIDYNIYTVTVFADPGIDAVYIDGKLMTKGYYQEPVNNQWTQGFKLDVAAGEHEITYKLGNYFSGEATMTVNGTAVTGNAFTTSGTDPEDTQVTIYLQGIEASAPETPSGSSDDGMGLTDYLLIVLVVLIVIMAIMVALRLMRS